MIACASLELCTSRYTFYVNASGNTVQYMHSLPRYCCLSVSSIKHKRCVFLFWGLGVVHFPAFCYFVAHKFVHARAAMCDDLYPLQPTNSTVVVFLLLASPLFRTVFFFVFGFFLVIILFLLHVTFHCIFLFGRSVHVCVCVFISLLFVCLFVCMCALRIPIHLCCCLCTIISFFAN